MNGNRTWRLGGAVVLGLVAGLVIATTVAAQPGPPPASPGTAVCPGPALMGGGGFGPGPGVAHEAIADALGISSQDLWTAQASGKSIATLAQEQNVNLGTVVDAALAAHSAQLEAAVKAGTLTQAQADAMTAFMKTRIESAFSATTGLGPRGFGPMGGRGMMGPGFGPRWQQQP